MNSDQNNLNTSTREPAAKKSLVAPLLVLGLLFLAVIFCAWLIWSRYAAIGEQNAIQERQIEALTAERNELEAILKLSPCEAKEKLGLILPEKKQPEPAPVSAAEEAPEKNQPVQQASVDSDAVEAACVFIISLHDNKISTGSGFFVAPGIIVTNRHVVAGRDSKVLVTSKALGKPLPGRIVGQNASANRDYAIIAVKPPANNSASILKFADNVKKTQKVGAWGFPDLVGKNDPAYAKLLKGADFTSMPELSYTEGVVSAVLKRKPDIIVHTAPISPGNSGGPLLNEKGEVVGINTMITLDEDSYRQASIALAASDLENYLKENNIKVLH